MRILNILFLLLSLSLTAQEKLCEEEVSQFQEEMLQMANTLETLEADFVQTKKIEMITNESVSRGKLYYQNPEKLKWEYTEPQDYKVLFVKNQLYINDSGDKSVRNTSTNKLFDKIAKLITGSVNGKLLQDNENFEISYIRKDKYISAIIIPKDKSLKTLFAEIHLLFNDNNMVKQVILIEEAGDATHIELSNIKVNQEITEFVFEP